MLISAAGLNLIKQFETCRLVAYQDPRGIWTIGWGHTGPEVVEGLTCTQQQADTWLYQDVQTAVAGVNRIVTLPLTQSEFDALASFTFNVGIGALANSTLVTLLNAGDLFDASQEFLKWDHVDGVPNAGLLRRRQAEQALFNT